MVWCVDTVSSRTLLNNKYLNWLLIAWYALYFRRYKIISYRGWPLKDHSWRMDWVCWPCQGYCTFSKHSRIIHWWCWVWPPRICLDS
jgi:hypothetical protein